MVAVPTSPAGYPMAPSAEVWEALSPAQRAAVVAALPGEVTYDEMAMPEGDRSRNRLAAYRLPSPEATSYTAVLPNHGLYESRVLGLDVQVEQDRLRFYAGTALLLESEEFIVRLQALADDAQRRAEEEARLREEETRRREEAEQEVARLRAELERLKR